jgi:hypothetical protein
MSTPCGGALALAHQRGAATELELPAGELRVVGVRRTLDELEVDAVREVELLRLDHRGQEGPERRRLEDHHLQLDRVLGRGVGRAVVGSGLVRVVGVIGVIGVVGVVGVVGRIVVRVAGVRCVDVVTRIGVVGIGVVGAARGEHQCQSEQ